MGGIKETCCSECIHLPVCKYKDTYLQLLNKIQETVTQICASQLTGDKMFVENIKGPECKWCIPKKKVSFLGERS